MEQREIEDALKQLGIGSDTAESRRRFYLLKKLLAAHALWLMEYEDADYRADLADQMKIADKWLTG